MQRMKDATFTTWLLWIALVLALLGTISNTAWAFGTVDDGNTVAGYVKAIALDVGMVVIAATLARNRRNAALWLTVGGFVLVSTYANYQHGVAHMTPVDAPLEAWRPVLLAAALPLMLFALVEIVATGVQNAKEEAQDAQSVSTGVDVVSAPDAKAKSFTAAASIDAPADETNEPARSAARSPVANGTGLALQEASTTHGSSALLVATPSVMLECPNGCGWKGHTPQSVAAHRRFCDARHSQKVA